jgi:hypothetical protein
LRIISFSIFWLNLDTSIREPIDWPFLLDDGTTFYYMTSEKYFDKDVVNKDIYRKKLFSIEYYMKWERQRMLDEWEAINKTKITEIENVVIVYTIYYENNDKDNEELSKIFNDLPKMLERVVIEKH